MKRGSVLQAGLICGFSLLLYACSGDPIKNVEAIPEEKLVLNRDRTIDAAVIYSDSAVVKARGSAPILDRVTEGNGAIYQEMPKGVKIDFYEGGVPKGSITSEYAIRREATKMTIFRKNVVVVFPEGKYTCQELTWDENKKVYLSPAGLYTKSDGTILNATNFVASQDFNEITMSGATAEIYTQDGKLQ